MEKGAIAAENMSTNRTKPNDQAKAMFAAVVKVHDWRIDMVDLQAVKNILECEPGIQSAVAMVCIEACDPSMLDRITNVFKLVAFQLDPRTVAIQLLSHLLRRALNFTRGDLLYMVEVATRSVGSMIYSFPSGYLLATVERFIRKHGISKDLSVRLLALADEFHKEQTSNKQLNKLEEKARALALGLDKHSAPVTIVKNEAWSDVAIADLDAMDCDTRTKWDNLLRHAIALTATKPSKKWITESEKFLDAVGRDQFLSHLMRWLPLIGKRGTAPPRPDIWEVDRNEQVCSENAEILKGLVWTCIHFQDDEVARLLGNTAAVCFKKVPNIGPRCPKIGNACVGALSSMTFKEAIAQLSRLKSGAKNLSSRSQIDKGLELAAEKAGMTVDDLQELSVPDYGFTEVGEFVKQFGEYQARISITGPRSAELIWLDGKEKQLNTVPAAVKRDYSDEFKALKKNAIDLEKLLPSVRHRIESSLLQQRHWNYKAWRERYIDHPICGAMARKLIWNFNGKPGIWNNGQICGLDGMPLELADTTLIELWHPIASSAEDVLLWRQWLHDHNVTQPFKQAHREIYVLTDAERQTGNYSNRFAAHIIRQHQFAELCKQRGWQYTLQGPWDSFNTPTLKLPRWNLQVQFFVEPAREDDQSGSGVYMNLATDQVRFSRVNGQVAIPLTEIMPIVFSEIMRDVDLFVGVCSIGNDPTWQDGGYHHNYWHDFSFGDLSATAVTRGAVLKTIIPQLKIAHRCSFIDKFLVVKGDIRTYKIHLGSGNILMEPNDQYLCIVPSSARTAQGPTGVFLPFEGDHVLSVILSKCFLLAEDSKIKDTSILSQINRR